jgi:hypothetical protein
MNTNIIPYPVSGRILLLVSPVSTLNTLFDLIARLALQNNLYILDGGNAFQGYTLASALRRRTPDIASPMQRVLLSRAFTCYQMSVLLSEEHFEPYPIVILDFLSTFYDQSVHAGERRRLLTGCIRRLQALSRQAPVAVWVRQRSVIPEDALPFLEILKQSAGQVWYPPHPAVVAAPQQLALLPDEVK